MSTNIIWRNYKIKITDKTAPWLLDGYIPELDNHPIGKKLNKLYKLITECEVTNYELKERHKEFVDQMRHWIRQDLDPTKYTPEEYLNSRIADYSPTKDNLKECNKIYRQYIKEKLIREKCKEFESHF